jgi:hypothetical protein
LPFAVAPRDAANLILITTVCDTPPMTLRSRYETSRPWPRFRGSMPKSVASVADVLAYVEKTKGAIGYVAAGTAIGDAKVLDIK